MKGQIQSIGHLVLLLMVGGVVAGTIGGPLYGAMKDGYSEVQQFLGMSERVELDNSGRYNATWELSALAHYTWDRAHSCSFVRETINSGGYRPLSETSYSREPPCSGQGGTLIASLYNLWGNTGNDMEGKFSRIQFVVKDRIVLQTRKTYGPHKSEGWKENYYKIKKQVSYASQELNSTGSRDLRSITETSSTTQSFRPWAVSVSGKSFDEMVYPGCGGPTPVRNLVDIGEKPVANAWPVVFTEDIKDGRVRHYGKSMNWQDAKAYAKKKYGSWGNYGIDAAQYPLCSENNDWLNARNIFGTQGYLAQDKMVERWSGKRGYTEVVLCPGDKGYLQVNKGYAATKGEFTGYDLSNEVWNGKTRYFPYIQITEVNNSKNCDTSPPEIPKDANAQGSTLKISADTNERGVGGSISSVKDFRLEKEGRRTCRLSIRERDPDIYQYNLLGRDETGYLDYRKGTVLEGKGGNFPLHDAPQVLDSSLETEKNPAAAVKRFINMGISGMGTEGLYRILAYNGLETGKKIKSDSAPLLSEVGGKHLEMYGDLLCTQRKEWKNPKWVSCDESVEWLESQKNREVTVTLRNGTRKVYSCDMESGNWVSKGVKEPVERCKPLRKNGPSSEKIDVLFYGGQFQNVSQLKSNASYLVDWNGNNQGLMSLRPFKSNREMFNFWVLNTSEKVPVNSPSSYLKPDSMCASRKLDEIVVLSREEGRSVASAPVNPLKGRTWKTEANVYIGKKVQLQPHDLRDLVGTADFMERWLGVTPSDIGMGLGDTVWYDNDRQNDPRTFAHEFGHSFAGLADEYTEEGGRDIPLPPNCAPNRSRAQQWWGSLAENNEGVSYFNGCSYVKDNIRPTIMSIMNYQIFPSYDYGPVNERRIKTVIEAYRRGMLQ
ncbi:MAG: hypothetical protein ABEJ98_05930 [Candidatus Nanohaloarchaea archaeon]